MIDLHTHVLPDLDDGPRTLDGALAMARAAVAEGTRTMVATPHINQSVAVEPRQVHVAVEALNAHLAREAIPLEVIAGGEISLDRLVDLDDDELADLSPGAGRSLLIECPLAFVAVPLDSVLFELQTRGFRVLLAHPERSPLFQREPERLARLVESGALCQVTSGALSGQYGRIVRTLTLRLLREGLVHDIASDAHDHRHRPPGLRAGLADAEKDLRGLAEQAEWLTVQAPGAILGGGELPPRPALPAQRRARWWRAR